MCSGDKRLISQTRGGATSYYLQDALGSTRALLDTSGTLTDTYRYDAFGTLRTSTGSTANVYRFTGQQFDPLTGNYSLRARYYAPNTGRFLSRDTWPIDHQNPLELSRYTYAINNPASYRDPSGYSSFYDYGSMNLNSSVAATKGLSFLGNWFLQNALAAIIPGGALGGIAYLFAFWFKLGKFPNLANIDYCDFAGSVLLGSVLQWFSSLVPHRAGNMRNLFLSRLPGAFGLAIAVNQFVSTFVFLNELVDPIRGNENPPTLTEQQILSAFLIAASFAGFPLVPMPQFSFANNPALNELLGSSNLTRIVSTIGSVFIKAYFQVKPVPRCSLV